jgi:hypothetical protein
MPRLPENKKERLSNVDYLYYILVTLAIMAFCLYLMGVRDFSGLGKDQAALDERVMKRRGSEQSNSPRDERVSEREGMILNRGVKNVPTPWGWPGHDDSTENGHAVHSVKTPKTPETHVVSDSLHRWVDRLVSEKQTVDDQEYVLKREASVRALLEDRYGRTLRKSVNPDRNTRPSQFRDAGSSQRQVGNSLNERGDKIKSKLEREPRPLSGARVSGIDRSKLEGVKTPWGW